MKRLHNLLFLWLVLTGCSKMHKMGMRPIGESVRESTSYAQSSDLSYRSQAQTAVKEEANVYPACLTHYEGHKVIFGRLMVNGWLQ